MNSERPVLFRVYALAFVWTDLYFRPFLLMVIGS